MNWKILTVIHKIKIALCKDNYNSSIILQMIWILRWVKVAGEKKEEVKS
jgi:hypothetical protein